MEKYKWNYNELLANVEELKYIKDEISSIDNKKVISNFINNYKKMINIIYRNKRNNINFNDYDLSNYNKDEIINSARSYYCLELDEIINILFDAYKTVKELKCSRNISNYRISISNDKIISFTDNFFKTSTPNDLYFKYKEAYNTNFLNINYFKDRGMNSFTILDPFLEKKYVNIARDNSLLDLAILPHEMFHYLINNYESGIMNNDIYDLLSEVDGSFADILYGDYYRKHSLYNKEFFKNHSIYNFDYHVAILAFRTLIIKSLNDDNSINYDILNTKLKDNNLDISINDDNLLVFFKDSTDYLIRYTLGFLIGLDIFNNYKVDGNKALEELINIRNYKSDGDIISLLRNNNITFMDDNYKNLKMYLKK